MMRWQRSDAAGESFCRRRIFWSCHPMHGRAARWLKGGKTNFPVRICRISHLGSWIIRLSRVFSSRDVIRRGNSTTEERDE